MTKTHILVLAVALLVSASAANANIVAISELPPAHTVAVFSIPGVVALCEFGVTVVVPGCLNGTNTGEPSVFPGTFISDFVVFANNLTDIWMCSDPDGEPLCRGLDGNVTTPSQLAATAGIRYISEAAAINGTELTSYDPGTTGPGALNPGFLQTYNITSDTPNGDAPEPSSLLFGVSGILLLARKLKLAK
jgi:hypothetical protein